MSKTPEQEEKDALEEVLYFEAELASLREELEFEDLLPGKGVLQKRREFVALRIARIEKQLPDIRAKAENVRATAKWLAKINESKRR